MIIHFHDYTANYKVKFVRGGEEYFGLPVQVINQAKDNIDIRIYVPDDDETRGKVVATLEETVRKNGGYLTVDNYALRIMSKKH
jgi:hypothetical protein